MLAQLDHLAANQIAGDELTGHVLRVERRNEVLRGDDALKIKR